MSNVTINGVTFTGIANTILLNYKYLALLSEAYTKDGKVTRSGRYATLYVKDSKGNVVFLVEVRNEYLLKSSPFEITFVSRDPGPFHSYLRLTWYYPSSGVYSMEFRVGTNLKRRQNLYLGKFDAGSKGYSTRIQNGWRSLMLQQKKLRHLHASGAVRPSPETKTIDPPTYYRFTPRPDFETSGVTAGYPYYSRTWTGSRTSGYWSVNRKGHLPVNPHYVRIYSIPYHTIIRHKEFPNYAGSGITEYEDIVDRVTRWYAAPAGSSTFKSGNSLRALSHLRDKMGADTANLAQDIGEIGETIRMVHKTIQRIHNANHALRTGRFDDAVSSLWSGNDRALRKPGDLRLVRNVVKSGKQFAKELAENWLELQYGWKPLLADVHDAIEKVSRTAQQAGNLVVYEAKGRSKLKERSVSSVISTYSVPSSANIGNTTVFTDQTDTYGVRWKVADSHKAFLAQTGFTNPINLAWELLPYSFVVDWFLPIGPWLESFTAFQGLEFQDGWFTQFQRERTTIAIDAAGTDPSTQQRWFEKGLWLRDVVLLQRQKLTSFPLPELPRVKSPWSTLHVLNGLALLAAGFQVGSRFHV